MPVKGILTAWETAVLDEVLTLGLSAACGKYEDQIFPSRVR
jgi:hypothetical protein